MLVQFMLKNVLSFRDETILDMTAVNAYNEHKDNIIDLGIKEKFLKVAAIYGANASGKSNLYMAMSYFQKIVAESLNNVGENEIIAINKYYQPFSFESDKENSEFQIVIIADSYEYRYGFEYNSWCIVEEWMYRKDTHTNRNSTIFERTTQSVKFGASIRKECDIYKEQIPVETLVLSFFNKLRLKTKVFKIVYSEIMLTLVAETDLFEKTKIMDPFLVDIIDYNKTELMDFLTAIDTGINDIFYEHSENEVDFFTTHIGKDRKEYALEFHNESQGTIKSIIFFIYARESILGNRTIFVDELNIKLHPLLLKFIIDLFHNNDTKAQLIYTTHDTTLMDKKFFRRDQIWFVEKDEFGCSELTSLSEYKVRSDASFEKDYLAGVYGGIPQLKDFAMKDGE